MQLQGAGSDTHQCREAVELGGDERCVIRRGRARARATAGSPLGTTATDPSGRSSRSVAGAQGMRPSAVSGWPQKNAEAISELPLPSSTTGRPVTDEARIASTPGSRSANSSPASAKTRLSAARTSAAQSEVRASSRCHRLAGGRHLEPRVAEVDAGTAPEQDRLAGEGGERRVDLPAGEQEVVDRASRATVDDIQAEHVDAVRGEVPRHGGEAPGPVGQPEPNELRAAGSAGTGPFDRPRESGRPRLPRPGYAAATSRSYEIPSPSRRAEMVSRKTCGLSSFSLSQRRSSM